MSCRAVVEGLKLQCQASPGPAGQRGAWLTPDSGMGGSAEGLLCPESVSLGEQEGQGLPPGPSAEAAAPGAPQVWLGATEFLSGQDVRSFPAPLL